MYLRAYPRRNEMFVNRLSTRNSPRYETRLKENKYNSTVIGSSARDSLKTPFSNSVRHNTSGTDSQVFADRERTASPECGGKVRVVLSGEDAGAGEVRALEEKIRELENRNACLREKCKEVRAEKIKTLRLSNQSAAKWRCEKKDLVEINQKLMKMMEKVKSKLAYVKQGYE
eukprot:TRINITY_DN6232_c0_g1_i3.p1 TRINITY_DN6232_c0_g1~~TRINITY_DN6232_c0_g1_i3.p1  ORF type:complete len:172 (+),score=42.41 TRINITY_DN6232_c0_g1_i3:102-617(+)